MEALRLSNQICFPIYALSRRVTALYQPMLEKMGLTYPQYLVMLLLWEHKQLSVKELGNNLMLDSGTLSPLLKKLEQKNLVLRTRKKEDERIVTITLTATGENLYKHAQDIPVQLKESLNCADAQLIELKNLLTGLLAKIEEKEYSNFS